MKRWIKEKTIKTVDGDSLQKIIVYECKPKRFDYLVFLKK
jgi:hypothetical protein